MSKRQRRPPIAVEIALKRLVNKPAGPAFGATDAESMKLIHRWIGGMMSAIDATLTAVQTGQLNQVHQAAENLKSLTQLKEPVSHSGKSRQSNPDLDGDLS